MMFRLFLDLDGVMADFNKGVFEITGKYPEEMQKKDMWRALAYVDNFYGKLDWMPDGQDLWNATKHVDPIILTGLPLGNWAPSQKRGWCAWKLGPQVDVITCMTKEKAIKALEVTPNGVTPVLVDDRLSTKASWDAAGGIFVHHTSAAKSIAELKLLGVI